MGDGTNFHKSETDRRNDLCKPNVFVESRAKTYGIFKIDSRNLRRKRRMFVIAGRTDNCSAWREFAEHPETLAFESERLLADRLGQSIEEVADVDTGDLPPAGREREATVRVRVNQSSFRDRILSPTISAAV